MKVEVFEKVMKLDDCRERLLRYCHNEQCKKWMECPEEHEECRDRLGFSTAVVWVVANEVHKFINFIDFYDRPVYLQKYIEVNRFLGGLLYLVDILLEALEYHSGYERLVYELRELKCGLQDVRSVMKDMERYVIK